VVPGDGQGWEAEVRGQCPGGEGDPLFITGAFVKKGKEASVHITAVIPVHGSQFGVSAPVLLCRLQARVPLKRVG
jgi:hypothetical protein